MEISDKLAELRRDLKKGTHNLIASNYLTDTDVGEIMNDLNELQWYKEQDLIKREDVWNCRPEWLNENMEDAIKSTHNKGWNECNSEWCDIVKQIPKAEPPFATDTNVGRNGDAETIPPPPPPACHYCRHNLIDKECKECNFESLV